MRLRRLSIFHWLLLAIAGTALVGALVSGAIHYHYAAGLIRASVSSHMRTVLDAARSRLRTSVTVPGTVELKAFSSSTEINRLLSTVGGERMIQRVAVERMFLSTTEASENRSASLRLIDAKGNEAAGVSHGRRLRHDRPVTARGDQRPIAAGVAELFTALRKAKPGRVLYYGPMTRRDGGHSLLMGSVVQDTGIGIDPSLHTHIFDSFAQADGSTARCYGGAGLGLAISARLARLMGGDIGVESAESAGAALDELRSAARAGCPYALVVLDMHMPGKDGMALARDIAAEPTIAPARRLMLSSVADDLDSQALRDAGIEMYLTKPVRQSELYNALVGVLEQSPAGLPMRDRRALGQQPVLLSGRVLLAKDNLVNREVALALHLLRAKQTGDELRASRERLVHAQRIAKLGSWSFDAATECVHHCAAVGGILFGAARAGRLTPRRFWRAVHPHDRARLEALYRRSLQQAQPCDIEFRVLRPDRSQRSVRLEGEVHSDGQARLIEPRGTLKDITERHRAQARIRELGTGYSSLSYMKQLPIQVLKIDRCFIRDVVTSSSDAAIVRGTTQLAHSLGLTVVAEGVEQRAQMDRLREYGCDRLQGFYYSRPLTFEDIIGWSGDRSRPARGYVNSA